MYAVILSTRKSKGHSIPDIRGGMHDMSFLLCDGSTLF